MLIDYDDKIFMPFNAIKGVGIQQTKDIIEERKNGVFTSFKEFKQRVKISESSLQALIYCGAFDEFNQTKKSMLDDVSGNSDVIDSSLEDRILSLDEIDDEILQQKEKELLGFNLVYNIYANIDSIIHNNKASYIKDLRPNIGYRVIGAFIDCKEILTKKNELMLVGNISDGSNEINVVIFPNDYIKIKPIIRLNKLYKIDGKTRFDNERQRLQLIINDVYINS